MAPALVMKILTPSNHCEDHARIAIIAIHPLVDQLVAVADDHEC
jgi:hypothetical protein